MPAKSLAEITAIGKTEFRRDLIDRKIRLNEQPPGVFHHRLFAETLGGNSETLAKAPDEMPL